MSIDYSQLTLPQINAPAPTNSGINGISSTPSQLNPFQIPKASAQTLSLPTGPVASQSNNPSTGETSTTYHPPVAPTTPTTAQGTYGTISYINGGVSYSDPRDNPNWNGGLSTGTQGASTNPVNLQTNSGNTNTVGSTALSGGTTKADLLNQQQSSLQGLLNGTGSGTPSSSLQAEVANQLYQSTLYSPQQLQDIQNNKNAQQAINARTIQETADIKAQMDNGSITKDQAAGGISETQRRATQDLAFLSSTQNNYANQVAVDELGRQNQIQALTGLQSGIAPVQVAPGSSLYSPVTGQMYQGGGASPAQIQSTAM